MKRTVSIVRYEKAGESVRKAVDLCGGLKNLPRGAKVFVKPNIVFWSRSTPFPKWGVITTTRVVEDVVILLREAGVTHIVIAEGMVTFKPKDRATPADAFERLGYRALEKRYGLRCTNVHERPFEPVDLGDGVRLNINADFLESDCLVDLPVLKTHTQTVVSLGIKNLKGLLDIPSRKRCHSPDPVKDLDFMVSRLHRLARPGLTLIDGIFTNERGPGYDGKIRRSNLLVASGDMLSADMVGARLMGFDVPEVRHLALAAADAGRALDLSDTAVAGESLDRLSRRHEFRFPYGERDGESLPLPLMRMGIRGLSYRKYDNTICTYCSFLNSPLLTAIAKAWRGEPWRDVEVLTGKAMRPTPGKKKTILIGKCIYEANKGHPDIREMIAVKGCPPSVKEIVGAFHQAGVAIDGSGLESLDEAPGIFMKKYEGKAEYDESLFRVSD